jgi:hypothetical protein
LLAPINPLDIVVTAIRTNHILLRVFYCGLAASHWDLQQRRQPACGGPLARARHPNR